MRQFRICSRARAKRGRKTAGHDAAFIAGGTNLLDLMKLQIVNPPKLVDVSRLALREIKDDAARRVVDRRACRQQRSCRRSAHHWPLSHPESRSALRRLAATAQQSHDRRQPATAHALLLFLRSIIELQQAHSRARVATRIDGFNRIHAILGASERVSPRIRPIWRSPCARSTRSS